MKKLPVLAIFVLALAGGAVFFKAKKENALPPNPVGETQRRVDEFYKELRLAKIEIISGPTLGKNEETLLITIKNGPKAVFSLKKNPREQIISLQSILKKVRMLGKRAKLIDLTLNSPHVIF